MPVMAGSLEQDVAVEIDVTTGGDEHDLVLAFESGGQDQSVRRDDSGVDLFAVPIQQEQSVTVTWGGKCQDVVLKTHLGNQNRAS